MKKWELTDADQIAAQSHTDLAIRRVWSAWLAAQIEIRRLEDKIRAIAMVVGTETEEASN